MFDEKSIIKGFVFNTLPLLFTIILLIKMLGVFNIYTYNLAVLVPLLIGKLIGSIKEKQKPLFIEWVKSIGQIVLMVSLFFYLIRWLGNYGVLGFIILIFIFVAYRLYRSWSVYMEGMRSIEVRLFGKTLDKEPITAKEYYGENKDESK